MEENNTDLTVTFYSKNKLDYRLTLPKYSGSKNCDYILISKKSLENFNTEFNFPNDYRVDLVCIDKYLHSSLNKVSWKTNFLQGKSRLLHSSTPVENKSPSTTVFAVNHIIESRLNNNQTYLFLYLTKDKMTYQAGVFFAKYDSQKSNLPEIFFAPNPYCPLLKKEKESTKTPPQQNK